LLVLMPLTASPARNHSEPARRISPIRIRCRAARGTRQRGSVVLLHGRNFFGAHWRDTIDVPGGTMMSPSKS
jgi:hypothetical protein